MKKSLITLLAVICAFTTVAQQDKIVDSLFKKLDSERVDSFRMNIYSKLGQYYSDNNAGKAIGYFEQSQKIAKTLNRLLVMANNYYSLGFCYLIKGEYEQSLNNYLQSVRIYESMKDSFRLSNAYLSIGNLYSETKDFAKTTLYYDKALRIVGNQKDTAQLASILMQKGVLFDRQLQQYDSAQYYLSAALSLARQAKDNLTITSAMGNIGLTYKHQLNTTMALQYFDSVLLRYKKMDVPIDNYAAIYNNIAATQSQAGNYEEAKAAFDKSVRYAIKAGSPFIEMENYNNLAAMYARTKNFQQQAVYLNKYYNIKDSLFTADNKNQLTQLEADYQVEKRNVEISQKSAALELQTNQRNFFISIATGVLILLGILAFFYDRIKKSNRLLKDYNARINQQNAELESLNQVKDRLFSIISHDLRNPLVTLRSYLSLADDITLSADKKQLFKVATMQAVSQTCDMLDNLLLWANMQIKNTTASVTPVNLEECVADVQATVTAQASQKNIRINTSLNSGLVLGDYNILTIALRNLLTNAIKFSPVESTILINAEKTGDYIAVKIIDKGIGMNRRQLELLANNETGTTRGTENEKGSGLGIFLVKELLGKINGKLLIESEEGKGSSFAILLPAI